MALPSGPPRHVRPLPVVAAWLIRACMPYAERDEVVSDLAAEHAERVRERGRVAAGVWLWRQVAGSIPALVRRVLWRGRTGFEPAASYLRPGGPVVEHWIVDTRYSIRRLSSRPAYAVMAVLTLALGSAGLAATYSVIDATLLQPLPVADESRVGVFWSDGSWTEQEFLFLRNGVPGIARLAAYRPSDATLERPGEPLRLVPGLAATSELFDVLGAAPIEGRTFKPGDDVPGAPRVAVVSYGLWQELGGDPSLVGRPIDLGGVPHTVVGVMPRGFWFPSPVTRIWVAAPLSPDRRAGLYTLIATLAPDRRIDTMEEPLAALVSRIDERFDYPAQWDKTKGAAIVGLREFLVGDARPALVATFVAMALILAVACVNVAALMLGQLSWRSTELAVRAALGAGRRRLVEQLLIEALIVGSLAGLGGAFLATLAFPAITRALPLGALAEGLALDWTVFVAAMVIALSAAVLVAAVPAFAIGRTALGTALSTSRSAGVGARTNRFEHALGITQIALAVLLTAEAGLLLRSVANLRAIDPAVDHGRVAVVDAVMPAATTLDERRRIVDDTIASLEALPGVRAAGATQKLPLRGSGDNWGIRIPDKPELPPSTTAFRIVTTRYLDSLGVPVRRGRVFTDADRADSEPVVVINESLAAQYFAGEDPVGRRLGTVEASERIIGVVADMPEAGLTDTSVPARYVLGSQLPFLPPGVSFVIAVRRADSVLPILQAARARIQAPGSRLAVEQMTTLSAVFESAVGPAGRIASLLGLLAALALALGAIGVYGVMAHLVSRRMRDFGVRIALGLSPERVVLHVIRRSLHLTVAGAALGIAAALVLTAPLSSLLYGVDRTDPISHSGAALTLIAVGIVATIVPARRAGRADPATVLRS